MMGKTSELSQDLRNLIVAKHADGIGYRRISRLLKIPVSTIGAIIRKWKEHHFTINRPRSGAPRKISDRGVKRIIRTVVQEPRTTCGELQKDLESAGTVKADAVLCDDEYIRGKGMSMGKVQLGHIKEEPVSSEDAASYIETLSNMECTPNKDGNFLSNFPAKVGAGLSKNSNSIPEHNKHLLDSPSLLPLEPNTDIASTSVPSPTYCSKCQKMFATSEAFGRHEPMHTLNVKLFPCTECGKYYRHNHALVIHRQTHTGEKPYCCNECGRCFNAKSSLVTHGKIHSGSGNKFYTCPECGKVFSRTDDLFNHQLIHYREKKYTCGDCGKCFKVESELVDHRKTHPAEELFLCSVCGKDFSQYSKLLRHQKTHPKPPPVFVTSEKMLKDLEA